MEFSLVFDGLDFKTAGDKLHREVRQGADRAVRVACESGQNAAKTTSPVRTGALRDSVDGRPAGGTTNEAHGTLKATEHYASYVNDGTDRMRPNPFFERGKAAADRMLDAAMARVTEEAIAKIGR